MQGVLNNHQLSIYQYQIGGHNCILNLKEDNKNFLLKPFDANEFNFYEELKKTKFYQLWQFIPEFYGIEQIDQNEKSVIELEKDISKLKQPKSLEKIGWTKSNSNYIKKTVIKKKLSFDKKPQSQTPDRKLSPNSIKQECQNELQQSWMKQLYCKNYQKETKYLKFQNLTDNLESPCILDLKLGFSYRDQTKQHTEEELKHKQSKFENSTSKTFGFRICGLFNPNIFMDKYYGRNITSKEDLLAQLFSFFNTNNEEISIKILKQIISQLEQLKTILCTITCFRFDSASLLILYDYNLVNSENSCEFPLKVLAKLIDFGNVTYIQNYSNSPVEQDIQESGNLEIISILGNIITFFEEIIVKFEK